jgi:hypothetical protein
MLAALGPRLRGGALAKRDTRGRKLALQARTLGRR